MAAVDILDALEPMIAPTLRRVPRDLLLQKAREVLREFCQTTRAWQYLAPTVNIVIAQAAYVLATPGAYAEPICAEWVQVSNPAGSGGDASIPRSVDWLDQNFPSWRTASGDDFRYFTQEIPSTITFPSAPITAIANGLRYRLALKPTLVGTQIDDSVTNEFGEEIAAGARAKLYGMHGEPWSNEKAADGAFNEYRAGRGRARIRVQKRFANVEQHWLGKYRFA